MGLKQPGIKSICRSAQHMRCSKSPSFDRLVGEREKFRRHFETERFCGLEVDDKFKLRWLHNW
jgi:hypothetical protein